MNSDASGSICIDRYLAVVHASGTLHRWRTAGAARCLSALVWFIAVVVTYSFQVDTHASVDTHTHTSTHSGTPEHLRKRMCSH